VNPEIARERLAVFLRRHRRFFHRRWLRGFYGDAVPHMWSLFDLAFGAHERKELGRASELYSSALRVLPHPWAYNNRGIARAEQKDLAGALADYDRAIELKPDYATAYNNRGLARAEQKDLAGALADYDRAIELFPDGPEKATAYNNRGAARAEQKDLAGALADYDRAIELDPQDATAYNNRADVYLELKDWESARSDYERRVALSSEDALNACLGLGIIAWRHEKTEEARRWFESALSVWDVSWKRQRHSPAGLWESKAIALLCLGRTEDALQALEQSLRLMQPHEVIEFSRYDLLAAASHPPEGLPAVRRYLEQAAERRDGTVPGAQG